MSLWIASNPAAYRIWAYLTENARAEADTEAHLATGLRIMNASDDVAGMAISERLQAQIGGLNEAQQNVQELTNMIQTAEGAVQSIVTTLGSMNTLAIQAAGGALNSAAIDAIQQELYTYAQQIDNTGKYTSFNGHELLDGGANAANDNGFSALLFTALVGANQFEQMTFSIATMTAAALGILNTQLSVSSASLACQTILNIQNASNLAMAEQGQLGAYVNALNAQLSVLTVQSSNMSAANADLTNLDVAQASMQLAGEQLIAQSATAMLAQANQSSFGLLSLLGISPSSSTAAALG